MIASRELPGQLPLFEIVRCWICGRYVEATDRAPSWLPSRLVKIDSHAHPNGDRCIGSGQQVPPFYLGGRS